VEGEVRKVEGGEGVKEGLGWGMRGIVAVEKGGGFGRAGVITSRTDGRGE
jgi:hypothetical protein